MAIKAIQSNVVRIDPRVYGNDGYLPGVKKDQSNWSKFLREINAEVLASIEDTKKSDFVQAVVDLSDECNAGDLAIIQHSGHGSQIPDKNNDESDGMDEVLCMYDGIFSDDNVWRLLVLFRPGVNVLLITDTCHSGTMFRSVIGSKMIFRNNTDDLNCSLVAIGTCTDEQVAADTRHGGAGSAALLANVNSKDYRDWILNSQNWLIQNRFRQNIVMNEVNAEGFSSQKPFTNKESVEIQNPGISKIKDITVNFKDGTSQTFS